MGECKDWRTPIGQNGGKKAGMKRGSEPAVVTKDTDEWKGRQEKLTATHSEENVETEDLPL